MSFKPFNFAAMFRTPLRDCSYMVGAHDSLQVYCTKTLVYHIGFCFLIVFVLDTRVKLAETNHMLAYSDLQFSRSKSGVTIGALRFLVPLLIGNGQASLVITYNLTHSHHR